MSFQILQTIKVSEAAEEYYEFHGQQGVIIKIEQAPEDPMPSIDVRLENGEVLENLFPFDIKAAS